MSNQDRSKAGGGRRAPKSKAGGARETPKKVETKAGEAATVAPAPTTTEPRPATSADDQDPVTYEAGWDSSAGVETALLNVIVYAWWFFIGGALQMLFGGMYLGTPQTTQVDVTPAWYSLIAALVGTFMVIIGFGILRLERWAYWSGWVASAALLGLSVTEIVRWATGTPITLEVAFFAMVDVFMAVYAVYLLLMEGTRKSMHFSIFKGSAISAGLVLCGIALSTLSLAGTLFVNHINQNIHDAVLLLALLLGGVLLIVMGFMGAKQTRWVWFADLAAAALLAVLSIYVIVDQFGGGSVDVEGLILSVVALLFVAMVVYLLFLDDVRGVVFAAHGKQALFSPTTLIGGLSLAVLAFVAYMLPGELGKLAVSYTVVGLAMGAVVGLLPGADPANRISAYFAGLFLAFASYVARGGLLPYTKGSAAIVVPLMLLIITGITAVVRSRAWFVLLLLGAGTMYGLVEPAFTAAPSAYLATAGLPFVGILLGFALGYTVSSLLELELVPYKPSPAAGSSSASEDPAHDSTATETRAA
jgi:hypothetical protein